jgi:hypothetical protein
MSILPGSEGRRDPERAEASRRQRVRFARDIGDEHAQAWAHEPRRKPHKFTIGTGVVLIAFAGFGLIPVLTNRGAGGLIRTSCDRVAVDVGPRQVSPGASYAWQFTGPAADQYVVTIDADTVTVDASGRATAPSGTVLFGPASVPGCRSAQTVTNAPAGTGQHTVAVFRRTGTEWQRVAVQLLTVR